MGKRKEKGSSLIGRIGKPDSIVFVSSMLLKKKKMPPTFQEGKEGVGVVYLSIGYWELRQHCNSLKGDSFSP